MTGHIVRLRNYSVIIMVGSIFGGIVQNPQAVLVVVVVALASATFVIKRAILHNTARIRNELEVHQRRNQYGIDLEPLVVYSP